MVLEFPDRIIEVKISKAIDSLDDAQKLRIRPGDELYDFMMHLAVKYKTDKPD